MALSLFTSDMISYSVLMSDVNFYYELIDFGGNEVLAVAHRFVQCLGMKKTP